MPASKITDLLPLNAQKPRLQNAMVGAKVYLHLRIAQFYFYFFSHQTQIAQAYSETDTFPLFFVHCQKSQAA